MSEPDGAEMEMAPSIKSSEVIKSKNGFVVLGFTGAPASGKGMWPGVDELQRKFGEDYIYEESISAPAAFGGDRSKTERYTRIADETALKLGDRKELVIIAHSMGSAEALMFLDKISNDERFKDKKIDLVVFSPINYGTEGLKAVWGWAEGTKRILENRDLFESHIACPLPYQVAERVSPLMTESEGFEELVIKDEWRGQRRTLFEKAVMSKELEKFKDEEASGVGSDASFNTYTRIQNINGIDADLTKLALETPPGLSFPDIPEVKSLLDKRAKLIAPYIGALLDGGYLDPERQKFLSDLYKPDENLLLNYLKPSFLNSLAPYVKQMFRMSYKGFSKELRGINEKLKDKDITLKTNLVYMQNDKFVTPELAKIAQKDIKVDDIASLWALADATHFTVAYNPRMMVDVVEDITKKQ